MMFKHLFKSKKNKRTKRHKKKNKKQRANKSVIFISLVIIAQMGLLITGGHGNPFGFLQHLHRHQPSKNINRNVQENLTSAKGVVELHGVTDKSYGSYARIIPPLDTRLRPYYQIATIINVQPKAIYQQFAVVPLSSDVPRNIQIEMAHTHLPIMTREFYVSGHTSSTISNKQGTVETSDTMKYNRLYNNTNEQEHFWGHPYVIPPTTFIPTKVNARFTNDSIVSSGAVFNRISKEEAVSLMEQSSNRNTKLMGY